MDPSHKETTKMCEVEGSVPITICLTTNSTWVWLYLEWVWLYWEWAWLCWEWMHKEADGVERNLLANISLCTILMGGSSWQGVCDWLYFVGHLVFLPSHQAHLDKLIFQVFLGDLSDAICACSSVHLVVHVIYTNAWFASEESVLLDMTCGGERNKEQSIAYANYSLPSQYTSTTTTTHLV